MSDAGADLPRPQTTLEVPEDTAPDPPSFYGHVIVTALLSGIFALVWYAVYQSLDELVWNSDFVASTWWAYPPIILAFSLAVGLSVRYLRAPTSMDGSILDELTGNPKDIDWRKLPATVVQSIVSLLSGAVVGPEGALGRFAGQIAAWYSERLRVPQRMRGRLVLASAAAAYNGLLANPLFTAVLGVDIARRSPGVWLAIPSTMLGGTIGFAVFHLVGGDGILNFLELGPVPAVEPVDLLWAVAFALAGMVVAIFGAICMQLAQVLFARLARRPVTRALVGGGILSIVALAAPILLFSGESQVEDLVADPTGYGFWVLLAMGAAKLVLLAVSFKSGFMGGPTFPVIFAVTSVALAVGLVLPGLPFVFVEAGILAGALMALFRTPLMVVLLTSFFLGANTDLVALIVISVVTVSVVLPLVEGRLRAAQGRQQGKGAAA